MGVVRDFIGTDASDINVNTMTLEHYPGMTEKALHKIEIETRKRWLLEATLIIHRYGRLKPGDQIVFVAVASAHRKSAFEACHFLIDWLKTQAPFWKLEEKPTGREWVTARNSDDEAAARWNRQKIAPD